MYNISIDVVSCITTASYSPYYYYHYNHQQHHCSFDAYWFEGSRIKHTPCCREVEEKDEKNKYEHENINIYKSILLRRTHNTHYHLNLSLFLISLTLPRPTFLYLLPPYNTTLSISFAAHSHHSGREMYMYIVRTKSCIHNGFRTFSLNLYFIHLFIYMTVCRWVIILPGNYVETRKSLLWFKKKLLNNNKAQNINL